MVVVVVVVEGEVLLLVQMDWIGMLEWMCRVEGTIIGEECNVSNVE